MDGSIQYARFNPVEKQGFDAGKRLDLRQSRRWQTQPNDLGFRLHGVGTGSV